MTLRLDTHHWFHANGILVHNKGGGGGGSSGGGRSSGGGGGGFSKTTTHTRSSMGPRSYVGFIWLSGGSRRRYGTYAQEEGSCKIADQGTVEAHCNSYIYSSGSATCGAGATTCCDCCHKCIACESTACTDTIPGCEEFYAAAFTECAEEETDLTWLWVTLGVVGSCIIGCILFKCYRSKNPNSGMKTELKEKEKARSAMQSNNNSKGELQLQLHGTYTENGETKPTSYNLNISSSGEIEGTAKDDDGQANVKGMLVWPDGESFGTIAWREKGSVTLEASGTLSEVQPGSYAIGANYVSSFNNTHGRTQVQSLPSGGAAVVVGTVVGAPTNK